MVNLLLTNGADLFIRNEEGKMPLHFAAEHCQDNPELISQLVQKGAPVNAIVLQTKETSLHLSVEVFLNLPVEMLHYI